MSGVLGYPFTPARAANYAKGRQGYKPLWFIVHCTDTDYQDNYPANLGKYWASNDTQVSVHFCVSDTMTYQYVSCDDTAYQARNPGNLRGIGVEIVGRSAWTRNEWLAHKLMLRRAAQLCAQVSAAYGLRCVPGLLSADKLRARASGLSCHKDMSVTFQGTHTDPGPNFPWDFFFGELRIALDPVEAERARVAATSNAATNVAASAAGGEDYLMSVTEADFTALKAQVARLNQQSDRTDAVLSGGGTGYTDSNLAKQLGYIVEKINILSAKVDALAGKTPGS